MCVFHDEYLNVLNIKICKFLYLNVLNIKICKFFYHYNWQ